MADLGRPSVLLPSIKCSTCGRDIEIAFLTEHICVSPNNADHEFNPHLYRSYTPEYIQHPLPAIPLDAERSLASRSNQSLQQTGGYLDPNTSVQTSGVPRSGRNKPPMIDPSAANRTFFGADPLTPESMSSAHNGALSPNPLSPTVQSLSHMTSTTRKPVPISRTPAPVSPLLQSNLDSAFPIFPTKKSSEMKRPAFLDLQKALPTLELTMGPLSPRVNSGADVLKRMASIKPGPFAGRALGSVARSPSPQLERKNSPTPEARSNSRTGFLSRSPFSSPANQLHTSSTEPLTTSSETQDTQMSPRSSPVRPPRPAEEIDRFLEQLQNEKSPTRSFGSAEKSIAPEADDGEKVSSQTLIIGPPLQLGSFDKPPQTAGAVPSHDSTGWPKMELPLRPGTSLGRSATIPLLHSDLNESEVTRTRQASLPTLDNLPQVARQPSSKSSHSEISHSPSESASTLASTNSSAVSEVSSQSTWSNKSSCDLGRSKSDSSTHTETHRTRSDTITSIRSHSAEPSLHRIVETVIEVGEKVPLQNLPQQESQPQDPPTHIPLRETPPPGLQLATLPPPSPAPLFSPDSPLDPAIQWDIPFRPPFLREFSKDSVSTIDSTGLASSVESPYDTTLAPQLPQPQSETKSVPKSLQPQPEANLAVQPSADGLLTPAVPQKSRGTCRGCSQAIFGKSVKAADGRLTGRYHRECFNCKSCSRPFADNSFYVLGNHPYCAFHYHQLNHSLCRRCNIGIEGPYLETDRKDKFHTHCFCCTRCMIQLREDYFEVDGRPYCERHAFDFVGRNFDERGGFLKPTGSPEKRRTRLMMMA